MTLMLLAVINDLYDYKVRNEITITFIIIGMLYNLILNGPLNLYPSLLGLIIPFIILFPLYISRMLGAGDIKLFCALGAFMGFKLVLISIAYSFIVGAFIAIILMLRRKNLLQRFKYFYIYIKSCLLCLSIIPYSDFNIRRDGSKMHFTVPIALGTILVLVL